MTRIRRSTAGFCGGPVIAWRDCRLHLLKGSSSRLLSIQLKSFENGGDATFALVKQSRQKLSGTNPRNAERLCVHFCGFDNFRDSRSKWGVVWRTLRSPDTGCFLQLGSKNFEVQSEFVEQIARRLRAQFCKAEQNMFHTKIVAIQAFGFLPCQFQGFQRSRIKLLTPSGVTRSFAGFPFRKVLVCRLEPVHDRE